MLMTTALYILGALLLINGSSATSTETSNFALIDASTREILAPIVDGDTIDLADYGSPSDVRAVYDPIDWTNVKAAKILVDGDGVCRREKNAPKDGSPWIRTLPLSPSDEPIELVAHGFTRKRCREPPRCDCDGCCLDKETVTFTLVDSSMDELCSPELEFTDTARLLEAVDVILSGGTVPEGPIECWHVGKITSFSNLLWRGDSDAPGLATFNYDLGNWDVSSGTDFSYAFRGARSFDQDIGRWDVSRSTSFEGMFWDASAFNQDIGNWNVGQATDFLEMFESALSFNKDIGRWDMSKATSVEFMFVRATAFNQNLSGWDVSSVRSFFGFFHEAHAFNQDIGRWDVSTSNDFVSMFDGALAFNQDISGWDVSSGKYFFLMFEGAVAFNQDISGWDMSSGIDFFGMFNGASAFDQDLCAWGDDLQAGADFTRMFTGSGCPSFGLPPSDICYPCS